LGISIPIPLFDRNQGNVLGASRKTDQARGEFTATERRLQSELVLAYQRYQSTKAELALLQTEILPQAESAIAATVKGFEFGKFNLLDVLEAQRTLFQTKLQYLKTQADFYRSVTDIERIVGTDQLKG
jgi:outer membrane protein, heavy metal efflux system